MRPVPQRGTGGARGGLYSIRKKVFYRVVFFKKKADPYYAGIREENPSFPPMETVMNAAAPGGAPPRRFEDFFKVIDR
jgi:hypothetical protein